MIEKRREFYTWEKERMQNPNPLTIGEALGAADQMKDPYAAWIITELCKRVSEHEEKDRDEWGKYWSGKGPKPICRTNHFVYCHKCKLTYPVADEKQEKCQRCGEPVTLVMSAEEYAEEIKRNYEKTLLPMGVKMEAAPPFTLPGQYAFSERIGQTTFIVTFQHASQMTEFITRYEAAKRKKENKE